MTAVGGHRSGRPTHSSKRQNRYRLLVPPHPRGRDWRHGNQGGARCGTAGRGHGNDAGRRMLGRRGRRGRGGGGGGPPPRGNKDPPPPRGPPRGRGGVLLPRPLTWRVVPSADAGGFFIALYQGLFKAQGLHVTFVPATSSKTVIAGQVKGVYDITGGNYVSYIQAQQKGAANLR